MATVNVARYFQIDKQYGSISPGKIVDIILLDDLTKVESTTVRTFTKDRDSLPGIPPSLPWICFAVPGIYASLPWI